MILKRGAALLSGAGWARVVPEVLRAVTIKTARYMCWLFYFKKIVSAFILLDSFGMRHVFWLLESAKLWGEEISGWFWSSWPVNRVWAWLERLGMKHFHLRKYKHAVLGCMHSPVPRPDSEASCSWERNWLRFGCCACPCCLQGSVCSECLLCLYCPWLVYLFARSFGFCFSVICSA